MSLHRKGFIIGWGASATPESHGLDKVIDLLLDDGG